MVIRFLRYRGGALICLVGIAALWQAAVDVGLLNGRFLPAPLDLFHGAVGLICDGSLPIHALSSIFRVFVGYSAACVFGLGIAIGLVLVPPLRHFRVVIEVLRPIPPIAWIPLAILWFGLGDRAAYFIVFVGAVFPIMIGGYYALSNVSLTVIRAAQCLGAGRWLLLWDVLVPAAFPPFS